MEQPEAHHTVERPVAIGHGFDVLPFDRDSQALLAGIVTRDVDHRLRIVGACSLVALLREKEADASAAGRNVQHAAAGDAGEYARNQPHLGAVTPRITLLI